MTAPRRTSPASPRTHQGLQRPGRLAAAAALVLLTVLVLLMALSRTALTYSTPAPGPSSTTSQHTRTWAPGVAAAAVASLAALASLGWLIGHIITQPPAKLWWPVIGLVLLAATWTILITTLHTPHY